MWHEKYITNKQLSYSLFLYNMHCPEKKKKKSEYALRLKNAYTENAVHVIIKQFLSVTMKAP